MSLPQRVLNKGNVDEPDQAPSAPVAESRDAHPDRTIVEILTVVREFTGADVAYIGEFREPRQVIRWASGDSASFGFQAGVGIPLAATYCSRLMAGRIPGVIPDTRADDRTRDISLTERASIGSYLGIPVSLPDGRFFGTMCALSHQPDPSLGERHGHLMALMAPIVAEHLERAESISWGKRARVDRVRRVIEAANSVRIALQPIVDLSSNEVVGYEALARFADARSPDHWFAEAWSADLGLELELTTLLAALRRLEELPPDTYLSVNASPMVLSSENLKDTLDKLGIERNRVVLEVTEHDEVPDYDLLIEALAPLRARGVRVAVDDVGAGFASLRHVLHLGPDVIKLDVSLTRGIERDGARAALASLFASFAMRIGALVVAEGIESAHELTILRALGVNLGQGYFLGRPDQTIRPIGTARSGLPASVTPLTRPKIDAPYTR